VVIKKDDEIKSFDVPYIDTQQKYFDLCAFSPLNLQWQSALRKVII
jgi:hypothetical protein